MLVPYIEGMGSRNDLTNPRSAFGDVDIETEDSTEDFAHPYFSSAKMFMRRDPNQETYG